MSNVLNAIAAVTELASVFICINYIYSRKYRVSVYDAWFLVLELALLETMNLLGRGRSFIVFVYVLIFMYQYFKFKDGFRKTCLNTMLLACTEVTSQIVCSLPTYLDSYIPLAYLVIGSNVLLVIVTVILGKTGILFKLSDKLSRHEWLLNVAVIICFLCSLYFVIVSKTTEPIRSIDYYTFGAWALIICIMAMKWQEAKDGKRAKEKELELHNIYNETTMQLIRSVRNRQHEFDNHLQAILGQHILADSLEDLIHRQNEYCKDIRQDNHYSNLLSAGTSPVIGFLYSKFLDAESRGCQVEYRIKTAELLCDMPHFRMIEILGVFIDNAIEAQSGNERKRIIVMVEEDADGICMQVKNPCAEPIPRRQIQEFVRDGYSTKGKNRGRGLANVAEITEQYGADFLIRNEKMKEEYYLIFKVVIKKDKKQKP